MSCYNCRYDVESLYREFIFSILCNILTTPVKVSVAITSSNFILFSLFGCTTRIDFMLFLLSNLHYINQHKVSTHHAYSMYPPQQLLADHIIFHCYAKILGGKLNPDLNSILVRFNQYLTGTYQYIYTF